MHGFLGVICSPRDAESRQKGNNILALTAMHAWSRIGQLGAVHGPTK